MKGISHHLLLCATASKAKCCDPTVGAAAWNRLKQLVKQLGLEDPDRVEGVVLRSKAAVSYTHLTLPTICSV